MIRRYSRIFLLLLFCTGWNYTCQKPAELQSFHMTRFAMGTVIEITVLDYSEKHANEAMDAAYLEISRIGRLFYEDNPQSPLYAFGNRTSNEVAMPEEVLSLVKRGLEISKLTNGAFDMTVGIILPLYDFKSESPTPPTQKAIDSVLSFVNYKTLSVDEERGLLISSSPQTKLTTGGIAKGYGVDRAIDILKKMKVMGALVNAGGDLRVLPRADGKKWKIGIQNPRETNKMMEIIEIDSGAVVTSGDYEKYFFYQGKRYHHIINPKTGLPADSCRSATIIAPTAEMADGLATGIFVMGVNTGLELLESLPDCEGLIIRVDGKSFSTKKFDNYLTKKPS
jgi:thiamine biosynthesis lipoprotein